MRVGLRELWPGLLMRHCKILRNGCWDSSVWNRNVRPGNRYFANVQNPDQYTAGWQNAYSPHAEGAKESRPVARVVIKGPHGDFLTALMGFDYVLKNYPGEG